MRLTSVIALAVVVLGIGYVAIFKQDWIKEALGFAKGYRPAKTPQEALDYFAKAIKDRDYENASKYVQGTYAKELERSHAKARDLGKNIDSIQSWTKEKAFNTKKIATALYNLDPFPKNFHPGKVTKEEGDKAWGEFISEPVTEYDAKVSFSNGIDPHGGMDLKMFTNMLGFVGSDLSHPINLSVLQLEHNFAKVALVKVEGHWKIKKDCNNNHQEAIGYYLDRQPRYLEGLSSLNGRVNNQRYESRDSLQREVIDVLAKAK